MNQADDTMMTRYLLNSLSEQERTQIENRFFVDDTFFDELAAAEDELIDDYARDRLPPADCARFEARYLNSARGAERVRFARTLRCHIADSVAAQPSVATPRVENLRRTFAAFFSSLRASPDFAFAAVVLIAALFGVAWYSIRYGEPDIRSRTAHNAIERSSQTPSESSLVMSQAPPDDERAFVQTPAPANVEHPPTTLTTIPPATSPRPKPASADAAAPRSTVVAYTIAVGGVRGADDAGEVPPLKIPASADTVRLDIRLDPALGAGDHTTYSAAVATPDGGIVHRAARLRLRRRTISVPVPARLLKRGVYIVTLTGSLPSDQISETIGEYALRVVSP